LGYLFLNKEGSNDRKRFLLTYLMGE
jgi:hypothetical protein